MLEINKMKKENIFGLTFDTCTPTTLHVMQTILIGMVVILTHLYFNQYLFNLPARQKLLNFFI